MTLKSIQGRQEIFATSQLRQVHFLGLFQKRSKSYNLANHCCSEQRVGLAGSEYGHSSPAKPNQSAAKHHRILPKARSAACKCNYHLALGNLYCHSRFGKRERSLRGVYVFRVRLHYKMAEKQISHRNKVIKHTPGASFLRSALDICAVLRCIREIISLSRPRHSRQEKELMNIDFMK